MKSKTLASLVLLLALVLAGCDGGPGIEAGPNPDNSVPVEEPLRGRLVAVSLPLAQGVALVDLESKETSFIEVPSKAADTLSGSTFTKAGLLVIGSGGSGVGLLDLQKRSIVGSAYMTKKPQPKPGTISEGFGGWYSFTSGDRVFVTADRLLRGVLFELNEELDVIRRTDLGYGQAGGAIDDDNQIWAITQEGPGRDVGFVSIIDLDSFQGDVHRLPGNPLGIAIGPRDHAYVSLSDRSRLVEVDDSGRVIDRIAIGGEPYGLDISSGGIGAVAVNGDLGPWVALIDLNRMKSMGAVDLPSKCRQVSDVLVVGRSGLVTCTGSSNVVVFDIATGKSTLVQLETPTPPDFRGMERPRMPTLVKV